MHLIVIIQENLPSHSTTGYIGKFIEKISSKQYKAPFVSAEWAKIRAREIRIFDFTIPEVIEEEMVEKLDVYCT